MMTLVMEVWEGVTRSCGDKNFRTWRHTVWGVTQKSLKTAWVCQAQMNLHDAHSVKYIDSQVHMCMKCPAKCKVNLPLRQYIGLIDVGLVGGCQEIIAEIMRMNKNNPMKKWQRDQRRRKTFYLTNTWRNKGQGTPVSAQ